MLGKIPHLTLVIGLLVIVSLPVRAADLQQFQTCNAQYSQGHFEAAITCYSRLEKLHGFSSSLNYNLGNAYAQLGRTGLAVLNYERASRLAPKDADILGNLSYIRKESGLFPPEQSTLEALLSHLNLEESAVLSLVFMAMLTATAAAGVAARGHRKKLLRSGLVFFTIGTLAFVGLTWHNYQGYNPAVVTGSDVRLLISPFDGAEQTGALAEGRLVSIAQKHGDYVYITDETGRKGWLTETSITPVIP